MRCEVAFKPHFELQMSFRKASFHLMETSLNLPLLIDGSIAHTELHSVEWKGIKLTSK